MRDFPLTPIGRLPDNMVKILLHQMVRAGKEDLPCLGECPIRQPKTQVLQFLQRRAHRWPLRSRGQRQLLDR